MPAAPPMPSHLESRVGHFEALMVPKEGKKAEKTKLPARQLY
jgi:hypothetical protein